MTLELATSLTATEADRLAQAEALVRGYCGWHIAPSRTDTVYVQQFRAGVILLPSLYVTAIQSIVDDSTTYVSGDYTFTQDGELLRPGYFWRAGTTVTFTHGYTTVPLEVTAVVQAVAQRAVDNPHTVAREQTGPFSVTYGASGSMGLLDSEREVLRRYRIPAAL